MTILLPNGDLVERWTAVGPAGLLLDGQRIISPDAPDFEERARTAKPVESLPRRRRVGDPL